MLKPPDTFGNRMVSSSKSGTTRKPMPAEKGKKPKKMGPFGKAMSKPSFRRA